MKSRSGSCETLEYVFLISLFSRSTSISASTAMSLLLSVAEDGGVLARPPPHRRRTDDLGVGDPLGIAEIARVQADRAQPELAARFRELIPQLLERRAPVADDPLQRVRQPEPDRLLRRPDSRLLAPLLRRRRDEKRDKHSLAILHPGREVDQNLAVACHLPLLLLSCPRYTGKDAGEPTAIALPGECNKFVCVSVLAGRGVACADEPTAAVAST